MTWIAFPQRAVALISGPDVLSFLQGLISNDINLLDRQACLFTALLTPQGKFLDDFFVLRPDPQRPHELWIDAAGERLPAIAQRLSLYKLRAQVQLAVPQPPVRPYAWLGDARPSLDKAFIVADPRHPSMGWRAYAPEADLPPDFAPNPVQQDYEQRRIALGLPDGDQDMEREKSTLLDNGYDRAQAIAWDKGCYMGQEITARMRYRGLAKWDLRPVMLAQTVDVGTPILLDDTEIGVIRSCSGNMAMARLRLDALSRADEFRCLGAPVRLLPMDARPVQGSLATD